MRRMIILTAVMSLTLSLCACSSQQAQSSQDQAGSEILATIESLEDRVALLESELQRLETQTVELSAENARLAIELESELNRIQKETPPNSIPPSQRDAIQDDNVRRLYNLLDIDSYHYVNSNIEERLEQVADFDDLMNLYSYHLDGIYAEMFSFQLGELYRRMAFEALMEKMSAYDDNVIDTLCGFLVFDIMYHENEPDQLVARINELESPSEYNHILNRLAYYMAQY